VKIDLSVPIDLGIMLVIIFAVLKVAHVISWSWLWVLSPLWFGFAAVLVILLFLAAGVFFAAFLEG